MDLIKQFNLPSYVKGKSFSEASKLIIDKFKDREDKISKNTMAELLGRLKEAQEYTKEKEQASNTNNFFLGGITDMIGGTGVEAGGVENVTEGVGPGGYMKAAEGAIGIGNQLFGKVDSTKLDPNAKSISAGEGAIGGTMKGAQAGMSFGPLGAAIGGIAGGIGGIVGAKKQNDAINQSKADAGHLKRNKEMRNFKDGGNLTDPKKDKSIHLPSDENPARENSLRLKYAKSKKLDAIQLGGFEDQKSSDSAWRKARDEHYQNTYKEFRAGKTGNSPNSKLSQTDPAYKEFWKKTKADWYKNNPRKVNEIVQDYAINGPAGKEQGVEFNNNIKNSFELPQGALASNESDFSKGGKINKYFFGGRPKVSSVNELPELGLNGRPIVSGVNELESQGTTFSPESMLKESSNNAFSTKGTSPTIKEDKKNKAMEWLDKNKWDIGRAAPAIANVAQLLSMKKPQKETLAKLGNRYQKQLTDEQGLVNTINNAFSSDLASESSGGSRGRLAANARAIQRDKARAISEGYKSLSAENRQEGRTKQGFDSNIDQFNVRVSHKEDENYAKDLGAYNTEKSKLIGAIGENVGDFSKERGRDDMIKELFDYTRKGKFIKEKSKGGYLKGAFEYIAKTRKKPLKKGNKKKK